jgi:hypothetical protein
LFGIIQATPYATDIRRVEKTTILPPKATHPPGLFSRQPAYSSPDVPCHKSLRVPGPPVKAQPPVLRPRHRLGPSPLRSGDLHLNNSSTLSLTPPTNLYGCLKRTTSFELFCDLRLHSRFGRWQPRRLRPGPSHPCAICGRHPHSFSQ